MVNCKVYRTLRIFRPCSGELEVFNTNQLPIQIRFIITLNTWQYKKLDFQVSFPWGPDTYLFRCVQKHLRAIPLGAIFEAYKLLAMDLGRSVKND
jgi:hypothetical protein